MKIFVLTGFYFKKKKTKEIILVVAEKLAMVPDWRLQCGNISRLEPLESAKVTMLCPVGKRCYLWMSLIWKHNHSQEETILNSCKLAMCLPAH